MTAIQTLTVQPRLITPQTSSELPPVPAHTDDVTSPGHGYHGDYVSPSFRTLENVTATILVMAANRKNVLSSLAVYVGDSEPEQDSDGEIDGETCNLG